MYFKKIFTIFFFFSFTNLHINKQLSNYNFINVYFFCMGSIKELTGLILPAQIKFKKFNWNTQIENQRKKGLFKDLLTVFIELYMNAMNAQINQALNKKTQDKCLFSLKFMQVNYWLWHFQATEALCWEKWHCKKIQWFYLHVFLLVVFLANFKM